MTLNRIFHKTFLKNKPLLYFCIDFKFRRKHLHFLKPQFIYSILIFSLHIKYSDRPSRGRHLSQKNISGTYENSQSNSTAIRAFERRSNINFRRRQKTLLRCFVRTLGEKRPTIPIFGSYSSPASQWQCLQGCPTLRLSACGLRQIKPQPQIFHHNLNPHLRFL